jgi:HNH endonuclease
MGDSSQVAPLKQVRSLTSEFVNLLSSEDILKVLKLSAQGLPQSWISLEEAVIHYACKDVRWESGAQVAVYRGGHNAITGEQSIITVNSIIGTRGVPKNNPFLSKPGLTNGKLFIRDRNVCAYCGDRFCEQELTREHIIPFAQNGIDNWMNVVTACALYPLFSLLLKIKDRYLQWKAELSPFFKTSKSHELAIPVRFIDLRLFCGFRCSYE